jgi:hypothetical protein
METKAIRRFLKRRLGRLFLGDPLLKGIIQAGLVLTAKPKSSKEDSEPSPEIS